MSLPPKPGINRLEPCPHGGLNYAELEKLGIAPDTVLDFSVCSNPFGAPPGVREALNTVAIEHYPDSEATELKRALAAKLGVAVDNLLVAGGTTELVRMVALAYFDSEDFVLIPEPTYGEYEIACYLAGSGVLRQSTKEETNFRLDMAETVELLQEYRPRGVFLCNPNNPTGQHLSREEIEKVLAAAKHNLVILDEAYIAFVPGAWSSLDLIKSGNLIVLRSMTKDYALAGLRLGYAVADEPIISNLRRVQPPWNVNVMAQKAGVVALAADEYLEECKTKLNRAKDFLLRELTCLGLSPLPSQANFFLVKVTKAAEFRRALLERGILVRDCTSFGLPDYIRLAPRSLPECQRLIEVIKDSGVW